MSPFGHGCIMCLCEKTSPTLCTRRAGCKTIPSMRPRSPGRLSPSHERTSPQLLAGASCSIWSRGVQPVRGGKRSVASVSSMMSFAWPNPCVLLSTTQRSHALQMPQADKTGPLIQLDVCDMCHVCWERHRLLVSRVRLQSRQSVYSEFDPFNLKYYARRTDRSSDATSTGTPRQNPQQFLP